MSMKHRYLYGLVIILIGWGMISFLINKNFMPSPFTVAIYIAEHGKILFIHLLASLYRILISIMITIILGSVFGVLTARVRILDNYLTPIFYTLYPIPKISFLPLLMLLLGIGDASKIALVSLILFFQIVVTIHDHVKKINESYFTSIQSLGASKSQIYYHVIFPAMIPSLFTSLRLSIGTSISVLFFAENYATKYGLGFYIMDSWVRIDYVSMFAGIVVISLLGGFMFALIDFLENHLCKWYMK